MLAYLCVPTTVVVVVVVVVVAASAWKPDLPRLREPRGGEAVLLPGEVVATTEGYVPSPRYGFPDDGRLQPFGVRTGGDARISLRDSSGETPALRLSLGRRGQCSAEYLRGAEPPLRLFSSCDVELRADTTTWFVLLISASHVALHQQGRRRPAAGFSSSELEDGAGVDFLKYDGYVLASRMEAVWDPQGHQLDPEDLEPRRETSPFVLLALESVYDGLRRMREQGWRCEAALDRLEAGRAMSRHKYVSFARRYCTEEALKPYEASIKRHEAMLTINGIDGPRRTDYDVEDFFENVYKVAFIPVPAKEPQPAEYL